MYALLLLLQTPQAISPGAAAIISTIVALVLPLTTGFFTAELAKFRLWIQNLGPILGGAVTALVAGVIAAATAWAQVHIPGLVHWIPADLAHASGEAIVGLIIGLVNFVLNVPVALRAMRLKRGSTYHW